MKDLLDNITRHTLAGPHARYAAGTDDARRCAQGFSLIVGFANAAQPNFAALARFCEPGEHFYCAGWSGAAPAGWQIDAEATMFAMLWEAEMPARCAKSVVCAPIRTIKAKVMRAGCWSS